MSGRRSDPYRRNNAVAVAHLQMAGHPAHTENWGDITEGIVVPHPDSPHHQVEIGQSHPDLSRDGQWHFRVTRHPDDPGYEQEGLELPKPQMNRLVSPGPEKKHPRPGDWDTSVIAHPRQLPDHLQTFLEHPDVRRAVKTDTEAIRRRGNLGKQFG